MKGLAMGEGGRDQAGLFFLEEQHCGVAPLCIQLMLHHSMCPRIHGLVLLARAISRGLRRH